MKKTSDKRHHVVVVGAGFGGLDVVNGFSGADVDVTIIDRRNYHLFQPLLYQVAGASLSTSEIAWPIRYLFRNRQNVQTLWRRCRAWMSARDKSCSTTVRPSVTTRWSWRRGQRTPTLVMMNGSPMRPV